MTKISSQVYYTNEILCYHDRLLLALYSVFFTMRNLEKKLTNTIDISNIHNLIRSGLALQLIQVQLQDTPIQPTQFKEIF